MAAIFSELKDTALIAARGADAAAFLHAQLTSDIAGMSAPQTQYSGYCSPKGRLLATFLAWRCDDEFLLQLPESLRELVQAQLSKYVLRAHVQLARSTRRLFGVWGDDAEAALASLARVLPGRDHEAVSAEDLYLARLPPRRYLIAVAQSDAERVRARLADVARAKSESAWAALDVAAGVPTITPETQERYVPQMVNLDLIGGVSYTKGCYPGQEIVARTRYLGRLKQRMYRVHVPAPGARPGDALYSEAFGSEQACGALLNVAPLAGEGHDALAVIQTSAASAARWKSLDGPPVVLKELPYALSEPP